MMRQNSNLRQSSRSGFTLASRSGFTLVELLVVITIIAILASLLLAAASGALGRGEETRIKAQIDQINGAFEDYKNTLGSYPPNAQYPSTNVTDANKVLSAFKRHFKKAYPQHRETEQLIRALVGLGTGANFDNPNLEGGMTAAESLVFFLTKMSDDPRYPISGVGGPSYSLVNAPTNTEEADPVENRSWWLEPQIQNLGPRTDSNFFDATDGRFIIYTDPQGGGQRQLNFWYLKDPSRFAPYAYFDTSRASTVSPADDVAAVSTLTSIFAGADADILNQMKIVYAVKQTIPAAISDDTKNLYTFTNKGKFQIIHAGRDESWGAFPVISTTTSSGGAYRELLEAGTSNVVAVTYPEGPWTLDLADTLTNFTDGTLADAQP